MCPNLPQRGSSTSYLDLENRRIVRFLFADIYPVRGFVADSDIVRMVLGFPYQPPQQTDSVKEAAHQNASPCAAPTTKERENQSSRVSVMTKCCSQRLMSQSLSTSTGVSPECHCSESSGPRRRPSRPAPAQH